jgi:uncharacterized protein YidB (DUF937 family)
MGLLDNLAGMLGRSGRAQDGGLQGAVMGAVGDLLSQQGGLDALTQRFQEAGMAELIQGWIARGPNPDITGEQLQAVLGSETVERLARQAGIDPGTMLAGLSAQLPAMIDQLTPNGAAPSADALQASLSGLLRPFAARR